MPRSIVSRRGLLAAATASTIGLLPKEALAAPLVIGSEDYPPYAFSFRGGRKGFDVERVSMALDLIHMRPIHRSMVRSALFAGLEDGTVDLAFPFTRTPVRESKYIISGALHTNRFVLAKRTADAHEPMGLESLAGMRVAVTDRHRYPAAFDALTNITRVSCSSLDLAVRRLGYGRVDAVIGDLSAMAGIVHHEGLEHKVRISSTIIAAGPAYALFPKSRAALATSFADALKKLEAAGKFKDVESRFPMVEPPK